MPTPSVFPQFLKAATGTGNIPTDGVLPETGRFVGDLEPALIYPFPKGIDYGLAPEASGSGIPSLFPQFLKAQAAESSAFLFFFNLENGAGTQVVTDGASTLTNNGDGIPTFRYAWAVGDLSASSRHWGQFKATRKLDSKNIFTDRFQLPVRPRV